MMAKRMTDEELGDLERLGEFDLGYRALSAECRRARESEKRLAKYACHEVDCLGDVNPVHCHCGLVAALQAAGGEG